MATLVVISPKGPESRRAFLLLPLEDVIVGRESGCAVQIDSHKVSRRHARIYFDGVAWIVEDLKSTNGCFVNERRVTKSVLRERDELTIGGVTFKFSAMGASKIPSGADEGEGGGGGEPGGSGVGGGGGGGTGGGGAPATIGVPQPRPRN